MLRQLLLGLALSGAAQSGTAQVPHGPREPQPRFKVDLSAPVPPSAGQVGELRIQITALRASPRAELKVLLSDGGEPIGSPTSMNLNLARGTTTQQTFRFRFSQKGVHQVFVSIEDTTTLAGEENRWQPTTAALYIATGTTTGRASVVAADNYVAPALRALPRLLGVDSVRAPLIDVRPGEPVYGTDPGTRKSQGRALVKALAELQAKGVDALFEDSIIQVSTIQRAIEEDQAESAVGSVVGQQPSLADAARLNAQSSMSCPASYVQRSGSVRFASPNTGPSTGLPKILIEARSAPHGFAANTITFYTNSDGTFNQCIPYDANGRTAITIWQSNGHVTVRREGVSSSTPRDAFANRYDQIWDLNASSTLPLTATNNEVAAILSTMYRSVNYANQVFPVSRGNVTVWYYETEDSNYYCHIGFPVNPITGCTNLGEGIYLHRYNECPSGNS